MIHIKNYINFNNLVKIPFIMATTSLLKVFKNQDYNLVSHTNPLTFSGATITIIDGLYQSNQWVDMLNAIFPGGNGFCQYFDIDWMTDAQALEMFTALSTTGEYRLVPTISSIDELVIVQTLQNVFGDLNGQFGMIPEWEESVSFTGGTMYATPNYTGQKSLKTACQKLGLSPSQLSLAYSKQSENVVYTDYVGKYYSGTFQYGYKRTVYSSSRVETNFTSEICGYNYKNVNIVANAANIPTSSTFCEWEAQNYSPNTFDYTNGEIIGDATEGMCAVQALSDTNYPFSIKFTNFNLFRLRITVSIADNGRPSSAIKSSATSFSLAVNTSYTLTFTPQSTLLSAKAPTITITFARY